MEFQGRARGFLHSKQNDWPIIRRINELWVAGHLHLLDDQARRFLPEKQFPMNNDVEKLRAVHNVTLKFLYPVIPDYFWQDDAPAIINVFGQFGANDDRLKRFRRLLNHLDEQGTLTQARNLTFHSSSRFVEHYEKLIVAFSMTFIDGDHKIIHGERSATTVTLEDIKQLYQDSFEILGDILPSLLGLNNLIHRKNSQDVLPRRADVRTLQDYATLQKADRLDYFDGSETLDFIVIGIFDNLVRNSIAHSSYDYDPVSQLITFRHLGSDRTKSVYLVEFLESVWKIFVALLRNIEVVYQLRKFHYVILRGEQTVHPSVFAAEAE